MIAVIDYGAGNIGSVANSLFRLGKKFILTAEEAIIREADSVILPGVGEASSAIARLAGSGLDRVIPTLTQPVLGICIGMQLMCEASEEGGARGLGIFEAQVGKLSGQGIKIPHMGWNSVHGLCSELFDGIEEGAYVYYVHSYAPALCADTIAITDYGAPFSGALARDNFYGTQFHPEKSGKTGETILGNFLKIK